MNTSRVQEIIYILICNSVLNLLACNGAVNRTLQLGVFMPYSGIWPIGVGISGAVPLAIENIRSDPAFSFLRSQGYDFNFTVQDSSCNQGVGIVAFSNFQAAKNNPLIDAFIGMRNICKIQV